MKSIKHRRGTSLRTRNRQVDDVLKFFSNPDNEINGILVSKANRNIVESSIENVEHLKKSNNDEINTSSQKQSEKEDKNNNSKTNDLNFDTNIFEKESYFDFQEFLQDQTSKCNNEESLREDLRIWCIETGVPHSSVDKLLKILRKHGHSDLPASARTLKHTPRKLSIRFMGTGKFWYFGIAEFLEILELEGIQLPEKLTVNANVDGIPLFESSKAVYWPILGTFSEFQSLKPFIIGLYFNENGKKPESIDDYLLEFIDELSYLLVFGYKNTIFECGNSPFDAPALAFVKNTKGHNSKKGCQKCEVQGRSVSGRVCFPQVTNLIFRTDHSFRSHLDPPHHQSEMKSPMENLPIDMIENFNLDYLHVALLGVTRKKLKILTHKYKLPMHSSLRSKLSITNFDAIRNVTNSARRTQPLEIHRGIRTLDFISDMKGTEFRSFILYNGIVALYENVHPEIFDNYLDLHIGLTICLTDEHKHLLPIAQMCFEKFVKGFKKLYGVCLVSYNVHSVLHFVHEVQRWGPLDKYSTFPYENTLGFLKSLPSSGHLPLEQGICRYMESIYHNIHSFKQHQYEKGEISPRNFGLDKCYFIADPFPQYSTKKNYDELVLERCTLRNNESDCWFLTKSKEVVKFISVSPEKTLNGLRIECLTDFYPGPLKSSHLKIFKADCRLEPDLRSYSIENIKAKLVCVGKDSTWFFFPLLHTFTSN